mmetsp:Transcript_1798/g.5911  ORF Transcript_1798/g.5911 Transcript_1798/m.5911 type:complete len:209 (-) Transcript_1798:1295-1921(-)
MPSFLAATRSGRSARNARSALIPAALFPSPDFVCVKIKEIKPMMTMPKSSLFQFDLKYVSPSAMIFKIASRRKMVTNTMSSASSHASSWLPEVTFGESTASNAEDSTMRKMIVFSKYLCVTTKCSLACSSCALVPFFGMTFSRFEPYHSIALSHFRSSDSFHSRNDRNRELRLRLELLVDPLLASLSTRSSGDPPGSLRECNCGLRFL